MPVPRRSLATLAGVVALLLAVESSYVVRPGDTLSGLAARLGTTVRALADANGIDDPNRILAGQRLRVPAGEAAGGRRARPPARPQDRPAAGRLIAEVARAHGFHPAFVQAVAWQESGWQMRRRSATGAVGIMQVMPGTGRFVADELVGRPLDLTDPRDNVTAGVVFLDHLWHLTDGDVEATLAGYFQGLASVRRNGRYDATERYVANVLALRDRFRAG
jgi:soluble lytic murein transglycosylase-like protein